MKLEAGIWGNVHLLSPARLDGRRKKREELSYSALCFDTFALPQVYSYETIFVGRSGGWVFFGNGGAELLISMNFTNLRCLFKLECACAHESGGARTCLVVYLLALKPQQTLHSTKPADFFMH